MAKGERVKHTYMVAMIEEEAGKGAGAKLVPVTMSDTVHSLAECDKWLRMGAQPGKRYVRLCVLGGFVTVEKVEVVKSKIVEA